MKFFTIWYRNLFSFFFNRFIGIFFAVVSIIWSTHFGLIIENMMEYQVKITTYHIVSSFYTIPNIIFIFLPFITILSATISIFTLWQKKKITALNAMGLSLEEIFSPLIFISILATILHIIVSCYFLPRFNNRVEIEKIFSIKNFIYEKVEKEKLLTLGNLTILSAKKTFSPRNNTNNPQPKIIGQAKNKDLHKNERKEFKNIFIIDKNNQNIITANDAKFEIISAKKSDSAATLSLALKQGKIFQLPVNSKEKHKIAHFTEFEHSFITLPIPHLKTKIKHGNFSPSIPQLIIAENTTENDQGKNVYAIDKMFIIPLYWFVKEIKRCFSKENTQEPTIKNNLFKLCHRLIWPLYNFFLIKILSKILSTINFTPRKNEQQKILLSGTFCLIIIPFYFSLQNMLKNHNSPTVISVVIQITALNIIFLHIYWIKRKNS